MRQRSVKTILGWLATAGILALQAAPAHSQAAPAQAQGLGGATTANPAIATQRVENFAAPPPAFRAAPAPEAVTSGLPIEKATPGDPTKFFVKKVVFEGSTRVPATDLAKLAAEYENREVSLGELNILARRVRAAYRSKGYLVADAVVPSQTVQNGIVRLVISDGKYGKLTVRGEHYYHERFIKRLFGPAMEAGVVFNKDLYKSLLILNEYPDLTVQAQFAPGSQPGTTDVTLNVKDAKPVHVGLDYNNFGNRLVGQNRLGATVWAGNSFTSGDEFLLRAVEPFPGHTDLLINTGYLRPIDKYGTKAGFQYASAKTVANGPLAPLGIRGDADIYSFVATHPLMRTFQEVRNISFSLTAKTIRNFVFNTTRLSQDELRELVFGYDGAKGDKNGRWIYAGTVTQGLGTALGGIGNDDPLHSRVNAGDGFTKLNVDALRSQDLKKDRTLLLRFSGQLATEPLTTAEQFAVGGPDSVRGFIQGERLGDDGFTLSAEYRQQAYKSKNGRQVVQALAFLDTGTGYLKNPQVGETSDKGLTGVGVGMRAGFGPDTSLRLDLGLPISQNKNVDGNHAELYCQAATRW